MVDDELRQSLHRRLDELLDKRSAIELVEPTNSLSQLANHFARAGALASHSRPLVIETVKFAGQLIGDDIREAALHSGPGEEKHPRQLLRTWLSLLLPLLQRRPSLPRQLTIYDVLDGLSALDAGEIQPIFMANTGKNRRANRWTMARAKLGALTWKKRLLAMGVHEKEASFRVTVAFEEQWETIRKWKSQCEEILGVDQVKWELHFAGSETDPFVKPPPNRSGMFASKLFDPDEALTVAGASYVRERKRAAELSRRKGRGMNKPSLCPDPNASNDPEGIAG